MEEAPPFASKPRLQVFWLQLQAAFKTGDLEWHTKGRAFKVPSGKTFKGLAEKCFKKPTAETIDEANKHLDPDEREHEGYYIDTKAATLKKLFTYCGLRQLKGKEFCKMRMHPQVTRDNAEEWHSTKKVEDAAFPEEYRIHLSDSGKAKRAGVEHAEDDSDDVQDQDMQADNEDAGAAQALANLGGQREPPQQAQGEQEDAGAKTNRLFVEHNALLCEKIAVNSQYQTLRNKRRRLEHETRALNAEDSALENRRREIEASLDAVLRSLGAK